MDKNRLPALFPHRHLLGIRGLSAEDIDLLLNRADDAVAISRKSDKKTTSLRGRTQINLFYEASTRTQSSFELAGKRLGADVMNMSVAASSVKKGETLIDTAMTLNAMRPDILIIRHSSAGAAALLAQKVSCSVVNAGDGAHEHPTQALLDALTIRREKGKIARLTVAICGDILHSRVARSNILLLNALGARVRVVAPSTLLPAGIERMGVEVFKSMAEGLENADVVMMLRLQRERMTGSFVPSVREFFRHYGLDAEKLKVAKQDALVMHPGPMNRGVEIASEIADGPQSVIEEQVEMGVALRDGRNGSPARPASKPDRSGRVTSTVFKNARIVDPSRGIDEVGSVIVIDRKIMAAGATAHNQGIPDGAKTFDCEGKAVLPGLVDARVFIGEPGGEHRETIASASHAAAAGGVTSLIMMPDTAPVIDDVALVEFVLRTARETARVNIFPAAAITKSLAGEEMTEIGLLREAGAVALTDGRKTIENALMIRRALTYARDFDAVIAHETLDPHLGSSGVMNEGLYATWLGLPGIPREAEAIPLERDLLLARLTGGNYHAAKLSTSIAANAIERAKNDGANVSAGVSINHLSLNENDIGEYRTFFRLSPPLRAEEDRLAMVEAVRDGTIDIIVSSHDPQDVDTKRLPFSDAAAGAIGLETLLAAGLRLVHNNEVTLLRLVELLSTAPARLFGLPGGTLKPRIGCRSHSGRSRRTVDRARGRYQVAFEKHLL